MATPWPDVLATYQTLADYLNAAHGADTSPGKLSSRVYLSKQWIKDHPGDTLPADRVPVPEMQGRTPTWPRPVIDAWWLGEDPPKPAEAMPAPAGEGESPEMLTGYEQLADYLRKTHDWDTTENSLYRLVAKSKDWLDDNPGKDLPPGMAPLPEKIGTAARWPRRAIDAWRRHIEENWAPLDPVVPSKVAREALDRLKEGGWVSRSEYAAIRDRVERNRPVREDWRPRP